MNHDQIYNISISSDEIDRIDKVISIKLPELSRSRIKFLIESGYLSAQGKIISSCSYKAKENILYQLTIPPIIETHLVANHKKLDIYYEDDSLIVLNKQSGCTVHPGAGNHQDTLANALLAHCGDNLSTISGPLRPGIVHRLDKDTSGLMVVAKNDLTHQALSKQIVSRELKRIYIAVIWGVMVPASGTISANIARSKINHTKMTIVKSGGKESITHYQLLESFQNGLVSKIECRLETGRTHQIRVHCASKGHSLVGDKTYGGGIRKSIKSYSLDLQDVINNFGRQALHSTKIAFTHPASGEFLEFVAPLPADMQELLDKLK